jgi:hypothetical protein
VNRLTELELHRFFRRLGGEGSVLYAIYSTGENLPARERISATATARP